MNNFRTFDCLSWNLFQWNYYHICVDNPIIWFKNQIELNNVIFDICCMAHNVYRWSYPRQKIIFKGKRNLKDWIFLYDIITIHNTMCLYNLLGSWYKILGRKLIIIHSFCVWKNVLNMIIKISLNVNDILILLHLITTITIIALRYFNYIVFIHAYNIHT